MLSVGICPETWEKKNLESVFKIASYGLGYSKVFKSSFSWINKLISLVLTSDESNSYERANELFNSSLSLTELF